MGWQVHGTLKERNKTSVRKRKEWWHEETIQPVIKPLMVRFLLKELNCRRSSLLKISYVLAFQTHDTTFHNSV
jgi:hypothetical protein